jgi:hypothetical protein
VEKEGSASFLKREAKNLWNLQRAQVEAAFGLPRNLGRGKPAKDLGYVPAVLPEPFDS